MKTMKNESIREALASLNSSAFLFDLPEEEFVTGGAITNACRAAGYDESGRITINNLNAWGMTVSQFSEIIATEDDE